MGYPAAARLYCVAILKLVEDASAAARLHRVAYPAFNEILHGWESHVWYINKNL